MMTRIEEIVFVFPKYVSIINLVFHLSQSDELYREPMSEFLSTGPFQKRSQFERLSHLTAFSARRRVCGDDESQDVQVVRVYETSVERTTVDGEAAETTQLRDRGADGDLELFIWILDSESRIFTSVAFGNNGPIGIS